MVVEILTEMLITGAFIAASLPISRLGFMRTAVTITLSRHEGPEHLEVNLQVKLVYSGSMSAQIRTGDLPYKILVPLIRFCMPKTCMLVSQIGCGLSLARVKVAITPPFLHPLGFASADSI